MALQIKNDFSGGLNADDSEFVMPPNAYKDALNITRLSLSQNKNSIISNLVGNRKIPYTYKPSTVPPTVIGKEPFVLRNTCIYFVYHPEGYHSVLEADLTKREINKIFENLTDSGGVDVLEFDKNKKITGVNIFAREEGDLLYFLDSLGRPTQMDIPRFKAGEYTPVTRVILDKCKKPPLAPPTAVYANDTTVRSNNLVGLYRFKYRWIYDDFEKSVFSPISAIPLPANVLDDAFTSVVTNNNVINLSLNSGDKNVSGIELAVSFTGKTNNWTDFKSVEVFKKADLSLADNTDFPFAFYNSSTYPNVNINQSILLFSYVPDFANTQEMPKNCLAYAGITEGFDVDTVKDDIVTIGTIAAGNGGITGSLNALVTFDGVETGIYGGQQVMNYTFSGIPAAGTTVVLNLKRKSDHTTIASSSYTTVSGDTSDSVARSIAANNTAVYTDARYLGTSIMSIRVPYFYYETISGVYSQMIITPPSSSASTNSISTWKWSSQGTIARQYFDIHGKTNGVLYFDRVSFPAYAENGSAVPLLPYINYKINDVPPIWAVSMVFLFSKDATTWLYWETNAVIVPTEAFVYFEVTGLLANATKNPTTANVLSYSFKDGDRIRVIRDATTNTVLNDTYDAAIIGLVTDPSIDGAVTTPAGRQFIKVKKVAPFTSIVDTDNYVIELYSPAQQTANESNQAYYEIGRQYYIIDAGTAQRRHGGEVTDQIIGSVPAEYNFYSGNAYFRSRNIFLEANSSGYTIFNVMDKNFVDFYYSAVNNIDGRASIVDPNARKQYYPTLIRHSQNYEADTNINGLGLFYPNDFDEYDFSYGDVMRMRLKGDYLKIFQKLRIGVVPLFGQLTKDATGTQGLIVTDKLLNPIQYRVSEYGLTAPESLASYHNADFGCDTNQGVVWRDSQDGVIGISEVFKMNSWAKNALPLRIEDTKIYGVFHHDKYIAALEAPPPSCATILAVNGNTEVICAEIESVNGNTVDAALLCGEIQTVNGTTLRSATFVIQNNTPDSGTIQDVEPRVFTYDAGVQDFPLSTGGDTINGAHGGFSALLRISITTMQSAVLEIQIGGVSAYTTTVTSDGTYALGNQTVPAGVDVLITMT